VRANLFRPSFLKLLALVVAVTAGILEEVIFRKWVMDYLQARAIGPVVQVLGSGLLFGLAHGVWGLLGRSLRAAASATIATGLLGTALAVVYVMSGRSLAPCIATHFLINALLEPGLVLAAMSGQMGKWENVHK
jgi:membrane protease YdiL (CAAX protease family)